VHFDVIKVFRRIEIERKIFIGGTPSQNRLTLEAKKMR